MHTPASTDRRTRAASELKAALATCRGAFIGIGLMSGMINLLYLTGSFFMLEVYDRVLPSRSVPTLVGLAVIVGVLYVFQGVLDFLRGRILARIGASLDESLSQRVFDAVVRLPLKTRTQGDGLQPMRDLDQVRSFLSGLGPAALFDLPWMPLYLLICFAFHVWIGVAAVVGALILITLTLVTEKLTKEPMRATVTTSMARNALSEASRRNAEVIQAMGMSGRMTDLWQAANARFLGNQQRASDVAGGLGAMSKVLRTALQSAVLGIGAYLVIEQQATAGIIIASSILTSRALAPVELAIANWKGFVAARQSWTRLVELLAVAFYQAAARIEQPVWITPTKPYYTGAPAVVCYAFSLELYLKLLILLSQGKQARGHELLELYEELDEPTCDVVVRSSKFPGDPAFIRDLFSDVSSAFRDWRYAHEHEFLMVSTTSLNDLARALHIAAQELRPDLVSAYER